MNKLVFRAFTIFSLFVIMAASAYAQRVSNFVVSGSSIQFTLMHDYLIVIPVLINGNGPYDFLLDTGANTTLVHTELANQLGLRSIGSINLITTSGSKTVPRAELAGLTFGAESAKNVEALFTDLSEIRSLNKRIRGVLGQNVLNKFNFILNYRDKRIEIEKGEEIRNNLQGERVSVEKNEGRLFIVAHSKSSDRALRFVLDSGISSLVLFETPNLRTALDLQAAANGWASASTDMGSQTVRTSRLKVLTIGGKIFHDLPVMLVQDSEGRSENGLLPTSIFQSVYFNNREGFVILTTKTTKS
jgi:predicted aspartyl protease